MTITTKCSLLESHIINSLKHRFWESPSELKNHVIVDAEDSRLHVKGLSDFLKESLKDVRFDFCLREIRLLQIESLNRLNEKQCPKK